MSEQFSLDDAFEGRDIPEAAEQAEQAEEAVESEAPTGEAEGHEPAQASTPEEESDEGEETAPIAAIVAERKKRQEAERRLKEYEERFNKAEPQKVPDVFEDQEGFTRYIQDQVSQATWQARVDTTQELMRERHEDYDAKEAKFLEMATENPALLQDPAFQRNPAKYAYEVVTKAEKFEQMQNVDQYEAKLRAELETKLRKELEAEYGEKAAGKAQKREAIMPTLTNSGSPGGEVDEGDESLGSLLRLG
ncbi:MAG TPA: hypothetical protein VIG24_12450 [Acidimicrobiia bacterium]